MCYSFSEFAVNSYADGVCDKAAWLLAVKLRPCAFLIRLVNGFVSLLLAPCVSRGYTLCFRLYCNYFLFSSTPNRDVTTKYAVSDQCYLLILSLITMCKDFTWLISQ